MPEESDLTPSRRGDVSRETTEIPVAPALAEQLFGEHLGLARDYAQLLASEGVVRGLIGPREVDRLWERHLLNCAVVESVFPLGSTVCDVGSGAGLPGIVLGLVRPDLEVTLVEPMLRRSTFLQEAVARLGLSRINVVRARAEDLFGVLKVDVATARAVAPLARLVGWTLPLVRSGGLLVAIKGESLERELKEAEPQLRQLGASRWQIEEFGLGLIRPPTRALVVEAGPSIGHPVVNTKHRTRGGRGR